MERVGITQLYHDHATRMIRMHERAHTTAAISRAHIEEQLLLQLSDAELHPALKVAWFAAILNGEHFAPFWVKTHDRLGLSELQMEQFKADESHYDHWVPPAAPAAAVAAAAAALAAPAAAPAAPAAAPAAPRPRRNRPARPGQQPPPAPQVAPAAAAAALAAAAAAAPAAPAVRRNPSRLARPRHPTSILRRPGGQPNPLRAARRVTFNPIDQIRVFR